MTYSYEDKSRAMSRNVVRQCPIYPLYDKLDIATFCTHSVPTNYTFDNYNGSAIFRCSVCYMFRLLTAILGENRYDKGVMLL